MNYRYIDTHAHLNLSAFKDNVAAVATRCRENGVAIINIGTKLSTSQRAVELAEQYEHCYAIVGLHPIQTVPGKHDEEELGEGSAPFQSKGEEFNITKFRDLATNSDQVVGIGECGFDYWHCPKETYEVQEQAFLEQIKLANDLNLPLMIHTRGPKPGEQSPTGRSVYQDLYEILKEYAKVPFTVHFYAGTVEEAKRFFDIGGSISFTGVITFASQYEEVVKYVPLDKLFAETDCPYVAPIPYRGKRAEPWMVKEVYKKIADIKNISESKVIEHIKHNVYKQYGI